MSYPGIFLFEGEAWASWLGGRGLRFQFFQNRRIVGNFCVSPENFQIVAVRKDEGF